MFGEDRIRPVFEVFAGPRTSFNETASRGPN